MVINVIILHCNTVIIIIRADKYKRMKVYANCETIDDVKQAVQMGAEGIGLCRTEHMFFKENRIDLMVSLNPCYLIYLYPYIYLIYLSRISISYIYLINLSTNTNTTFKRLGSY